MAESIKLRLANREAKYFSLKGWTQRQDTKSQTSPSGKSVGPAVVDLQVRALGDVRESGTSRAPALKHAVSIETELQSLMAMYRER
jgi:hypothetical protein